jgi:hypothetical protein
MVVKRQGKKSYLNTIILLMFCQEYFGDHLGARTRNLLLEGEMP